MTLYSKRNVIGWQYEKPNPPDLNGIKFVDKKGYVRILKPRSEYRKGYIYEHRLMMETYLQRKLLPFESVHHINEIKVDNRLENLFLTTNSEHTVIHREGKPQSLKKRTNMRRKVRNRRKTTEIRKRDARGRYS